jgi:UDPglucose--hexose-1-phosphate uridylyltransferase
MLRDRQRLGIDALVRHGESSFGWRHALFDTPHRRFNPLNNKWILVSPHRAKRPWLGQVDLLVNDTLPAHDPDCYLCSGNIRAEGTENPQYSGVFLFNNDFPALLASSVRNDRSPEEPLFQAEPATGTCRVVCFSPDHGRTLPELSNEQVRALIDIWAEQTAELSKDHQWVQLFENKGAMMGCSNPHPHGQIWASNHIPDEVLIECTNQTRYFAEHRRVLLLDVVDQEIQKKERIIVQTEYWLAIVPWWASWPFETLLLPRFVVQSIDQLEDAQREDLAIALRELTARYDNLFVCSFPYSMGWHGAPHDGGDYQGVQLHAHFYPPLLRSASVRKFMVGYEMLAEPQRDLTPEQAAAALQAVSPVHYKQAQSGE